MNAIGFAPFFLFGVESHEQRCAVGAEPFLVVSRLVVDRQQVIAVGQQQGPTANHHPLLERHEERIGPRLGVIARYLGFDTRRGPGIAKTADVEQPHESVRGLPNDGIAVGVKRCVGDDLRIGPFRFAFFLAHAVDGRHLGIFSVAAVIGNVQIAAGQFFDRGGMLVLARKLRAIRARR